MTWRIGEILVRKRLISWEQLEECLNEQNKTREMTGEILIKKGYISAQLFYMALADQYGLKFVDLRRAHVNPKAIERVPRSVAEKYLLIPLEIMKDTLIIGISNPMKVLPEEELGKLSGLPRIQSVLCMPTQILHAITEHYPTPSSQQN